MQKCLWLSIDNNNKTKPIKVVNEEIQVTFISIPTNEFKGFLSGKILGFGRDSEGQLKPIKVTLAGGL